MTREELEKKLIVGTKIKIGEEYSKLHGDFESGQIIELVEGYFDYDNGLYLEIQTAPSAYWEHDNDWDSIYHMFGNNLDGFEDCTIEEVEQKYYDCKE